MKKIYQIISFLLAVCLLTGIVGCRKKEQKADAKYTIYQINQSGTTLVPNGYDGTGKSADEEVKGTVKELAEKYGINVFTMTGFLDGINDSLKVANPIETMDEDTEVSLAFDKELLYKNMVDAKADWLYELPQWDKIFTEEKKKVLYKEQKNARTIHVEKKVYPNDPCPCGSGKKYKKCCGKNK